MARTPKKKKLLRRIAVVGDGFTEKIYFEQLREEEHLKNVVIKPELPGKYSKGGTYKKALSTAKSLIEDGYDHVYCLIDFDTVLSENKLAEFNKEIRDISKKEITVYISNPCFETWILVHYNKTGREFANCATVEKDISKHLKDYCKEQEYLRKKNLYRTLRPNLESQAIPNADFLESDRESKGINYPRAEVYKFFLKEKVIRNKKK
jgi:hypothetical protein